jgi:phosphoribosylformimino-5-aminoimidazole carboxamide ribotide isomerase
VYSDKPLEVAKRFEDAGLKRLHLVDLDGAKAGKVSNWPVLEELAGHTDLSIDFGGGISSPEDAQRALDAGASYITVGSLAVREEAELLGWMQEWGADRFILGADVKEEHLVIRGWTEKTMISVFSFIENYWAKGVQQIFCTDVSKDGELSGPSLSLYSSIIQRFPGLHFIASGGVGHVQDLEQLKAIGCKGVIIGKAIYEGRISLEELNNFF